MYGNKYLCITYTVVAVIILLMVIVGVDKVHGGVMTSAGVEVNANVNSINELSVVAKDFNGKTVPAISFGVGNRVEWTPCSSNYIEVSVNDNWWAWKLEIYTNNFRRGNQGYVEVCPSTASWGISYGGMIESTTTPKRIPLCWAIRDDPVKGLNGMPVPADDVIGSTWTYIMDKSDRVDTITSSGTVQGAKWEAREGYAVVMYGSQRDITIIRSDFSGSSKQEPATSPVAVMLNAEYPAAAGEYRTIIWFDLVHQ